MIDNFEPIRIDTSEPPPEAERVVIFSIDDVDYTAPREVSGALAWRALEFAAQHGPTAAAHFMVAEAMGDKAIQALKTCEHLTRAQVRQILARLAQAYWGDLEGLTSDLGKAPAGGSGA